MCPCVALLLYPWVTSQWLIEDLPSQLRGIRGGIRFETGRGEQRAEHQAAGAGMWFDRPVIEGVSKASKPKPTHGYVTRARNVRGLVGV